MVTGRAAGAWLAAKIRRRKMKKKDLGVVGAAALVTMAIVVVLSALAWLPR